MPYLRRTVTAGATVEVRKYYSPRFGKIGRREAWSGPSSEAMERINEKRALEKLRWLMNANFSPGDWHLVLTYRRENRCKPQEAERRLDNFMRSARAIYRKLGRELKYISVTEYLSTAIHHHLVVNSIDVRFLQAAWKWGQIRPTVLYTYDHYALAEYFIKETKTSYKTGVRGKRWNQSSNLEKPHIKTEVVKADSWREHPQIPSGYRMVPDTFKIGYDDYNGYAYQEYRLVWESPPEEKNRKEKNCGKDHHRC